MVRRVGIFRLLPLVFCLAVAGVAHAVERAPSQAVAEVGGASGDALRDREKAARIAELIQGALPADINPSSLLAISAADPDADKAIEILFGAVGQKDGAQMIEAQRGRLSDDRIELLVAQWRFLSLSNSTRAELLAEHAAKRKRLEDEAAQRARKDRQAATLRAAADALSALLEGEPPKGGPVARHLVIDLTDPDGLAQSPERRAAFLAALRSETPPTNLAAAGAGDELVAAQARLDRLRARFLALSEARRRELLAGAKAGAQDVQATEQAALADAEAAAAERALALKTAEAARSEALRLALVERAALLAVQQQQAQYRADLAAREGRLAEVQDASLGWVRRVRELGARSILDEMKTADADRLYLELVVALQAGRDELRRAMQAIATAGDDVPQPPEIDGAVRALGEDAAPLLRLHAELGAEALRLRSSAERLAWDVAEARRAAMIAMNEARLSLLNDMSPSARARIKGFGPDGVAQVRRELSQIALEARFTLLRLGPLGRDALGLLRAMTLTILIAIAQIVVALLAFRLWRRHGDQMLAPLEASCRSAAGGSAIAAVSGPLIAYVRKVRRPLDWLLLALLLRWAFGTRADWPGLDYVWIVSAWVFAGWLAVRMVDALAEGRGAPDPDDALRLRSLRLVAVAIVACGLILALADATVGRGAIYSWVLRGCWLLVAPVALVLIHWWRQRIDALTLARADTNPVLGWSATHLDGPLRLPARAAAGGVLLALKLQRYGLRRAGDVALIRQALDFRYRRRVAARASQAAGDPTCDPLGDEAYAALDPLSSIAGSPIFVPEDARGQLLAEVRTARSRVCALTGERGLGKTSLLSALADELGAEACLFVRVEGESYEAVLSAISAALGLAAEPTVEMVDEALRSRNIRLICIDDAQRLIRPYIGGLAHFDGLIRFAQRSQSPTTWLIAVGGPAWRYLQRARGDRAVFDLVTPLQRWSAGSIEAMIANRSREAKLDPDFSGLDLPPQLDFDAEAPAAEKARRAYFRLLADQARGNPAIALEFWRRSLRVERDSGRVVVRAFASPDLAVIDRQPPSSLFVLRAILQMEQALESDVVACTDLPPAVVADAIRALNRLGVIEAVGGRWRIVLVWYREVMASLERRNLLTG